MDIKPFYNLAKQYYKNENTGHDFKHIKRVLKMCKQIWKHEGGDYFTLCVAALFHDVHRVLSKDKHVSASESLYKVKELLEPFNLDSNTLNKILYLVEFHDEKELKDATFPEVYILIDADIIDALGKRGLKRTLTYCKTKNIPTTNLKHKLTSNEYVPDINPLSTSHYVYRTMIPQANMLHSAAAQKLAKQKINVLKRFVEKQTKIKYEDIEKQR